MGLDMYLYEEEYVSNYEFSKDAKDCYATEFNITIDRTFKDGTTDSRTIIVDRPTQGIHIKIPVMYWRKANAIHKWFVDYSGREDDCSEIEVDGQSLIDLRDLCQQVLADHKKAPELLPTQEGFFFGSTEYDEYYFETLQGTVEALKDVKPDSTFIYRASW